MTKRAEQVHQCIIQGPELLVTKRNVTLSPDKPVLTTPRMTLRHERLMDLPLNAKKQTHRVVAAVRGTTGAPDHMEIMSMQMEQMP